MMFAFPPQKTLHSQRIFKIWIAIFFMAYLPIKLFSRDQCRETILFLRVKVPRLLGNVSEGKEFQKTVSLSLSMSWSEPRTHPWIWIGCDMGATFLYPPLYFCPRWQSRMWSEVHNSFPVRRECLALPVSYHFPVMSPVQCWLVIANCCLDFTSILSCKVPIPTTRTLRWFNAPIDRTRIINLSSRITRHFR
jgi:hypothetical protein